MTSSNQDHPNPGPPATAGTGRPGQPERPEQPGYADRVYRSLAGICGGVLLLVLAGWLGGDAVVRGTGRAPWLALAGLLLAVPLIVAFTLRPAVYANDERIRVRNPFRTITVPWAGVDSLRAGYSTELFAGGRKFQLWAIPVSLRARKRAAREDARVKAGGEGGRGSLFGMPNLPTPARGRTRPPGTSGGDETIRSPSDQALSELRDLSDRHPADDESARPGAVIRWAYEVIGPAAAGAVVLAVLLAVG